EGVLNAGTGGPACRVKAAAARKVGRRVVVENHVNRAARPRGPAFAIEQGRAHRIAEAASQRGVEIRTRPAGAGDGGTGDGEAGVGPIGGVPARVRFDAEDCAAQLIVVADLTAAGESRASDLIAEQCRAKRVGNVRRGQSGADVAAQIQSRPTPGGAWR